MKRKGLLKLMLACFLLVGITAFTACNDTTYVQGEKGERGEQGIQGIQGEKGEQGEQGIQGIQGIQGEKGERGEQGIQGIQGEKGERGEQGIQGIQGIQGEQGVGIDSIVFDEDGNLLVTFSDGTTQTLAIPEKQEHVHTFGDWINYTQEEIPCEERIFYHACTECSTLEWKKGTYAEHDFSTQTVSPTCQEQGYDKKTCTLCGKIEYVNYTPIQDHLWETTYTIDNSFHWISCENCDETKNVFEHSIDHTGYCTVCDQPLAPSEGLIYDISADGTYYEIIGYEGTATKIVCGGTYKSLPVKSVYDEVFADNYQIVSVSFLDEISTIGKRAFSGCRNLSHVTLNDTLVSIDDYAFQGTNLTEITIPDSVTSLGEGVFSSCYNLVTASLGDGITSIPSHLFNSTALESISLSDKITFIGSNAFAYTNLTEITIPDSVTSIDTSTFTTCANLTSVIIGNGTTEILSYAFAHCDNLTTVTLGDKVRYIADDAFAYCSNLNYTQYGNAYYLGTATNPYYALIRNTNSNFSTYEIHAQTVLIAAEAFYNCPRLTRITIPDSVKYINSSAFAYCSNLSLVMLDKGVEFIDDNAFLYCSELLSLFYKGDVQSWKTIEDTYYLSRMTVYFYSEDGTNLVSGYTYWHYDESGNVVFWGDEQQ